jgi:nicotinate-nucleotide adenylyltransferase
VAELAQLAVVPRLGSVFDPESAAARKVVHEIGQEPVVVRASSLPISASDLRRRVREGRSIAFRLPEAVEAYIRARRLYRAEGS